MYKTTNIEKLADLFKDAVKQPPDESRISIGQIIIGNHFIVNFYGDPCTYPKSDIDRQTDNNTEPEK